MKNNYTHKNHIYIVYFSFLLSINAHTNYGAQLLLPLQPEAVLSLKKSMLGNALTSQTRLYPDLDTIDGISKKFNPPSPSDLFRAKQKERLQRALENQPS